MTYLKTLCLLLFVCSFYPSTAAMTATAAQLGDEALTGTGKTLVIGTKEAAPFSFKDENGEWQGISISLWRTVADRLGLEYEFREYDLKGLLTALEEGSVDAGVAALTITAEREKKFDFTHPFYLSGLGIGVIPKPDSGWISLLDRFFSPAFLKVVAALVLLLLIVGFMIWLFERRKNRDQFGGSALEGIGSGFWWSAVTMTTVGYGDKAPRTFWGRIVGFLWMFAGIIVISSFTAAITSTLTVSQIEARIKGPEDLPRVRVGTVANSTSGKYLDERHIAFRHFDSPAAALEGLVQGEADAVVYDAPILRYLTQTSMQGQVTVLKAVFEKQQYGLALPAGSDLREPVNWIILETINRQDWWENVAGYVGVVDSLIR